MSLEVEPKRPMRIAVVGDVHDQWEPGDAIALHQIGADLVLFVGDFGNESVDVVRAVASLDIPKAVVLGNHDAWYSATDWGRKKSPYQHTQEDRVQQQLDALGAAHVGYGKLDLPQFGLSVVGGRPFSWGGSTWNLKQFYAERYGIHNFAESVERMQQVIQSTACETLVMLGHCGPTGLGEAPEAICGKDWAPIGGDHGDPDLADAIAFAHTIHKRVALVAFGHMHHRLRHTQTVLRQRLVVGSHNTIYLNAACVPRLIKTPLETRHHFALVHVQGQPSLPQITRVDQVWVSQTGAIAAQETLFRAVETGRTETVGSNV